MTMRIDEISEAKANLNWLQGVFYHGTARKNLTFRPNRVTYFTPFLKDAISHAGMDAEVDGGRPVVIQVRLLVKRPIKLDTMLMQDLHLYSHEEMVQQLKAQGYDAAISNNGEYQDEIAVFYPKSIQVERVIRLDQITETNAQLLDYLRYNPLSHDYMDSQWYHEVWRAFIDYLSPDNRRKLEAYFDLPAEETNFSYYYSLPPRAQRFFADFMRDQNYTGDVLHHDSHGAPAWMLMSANQEKLLPASTWIVHFTDFAREIAEQGFQKGVTNLDELHLTRLNDAFGNTTRRTGDAPGWNFGYLAGSTDLDRRVNGYGKHAVLFQSRGVSIYHHGDNEDQVVFYGPSVRKASMIVLEQAPNGLWRAVRGGKITARNRSLTRLVRGLISHK